MSISPHPNWQPSTQTAWEIQQSKQTTTLRNLPHYPPRRIYAYADVIMIQAEFENGLEDENNFQIQIQEIDFQNRADEDDA